MPVLEHLLPPLLGLSASPAPLLRGKPQCLQGAVDDGYSVGVLRHCIAVSIALVAMQTAVEKIHRLVARQVQLRH